LLYLLDIDPFSLIKLLDLLNSPLFEPLLTVSFESLLSTTYDLLPLCPSASFLPWSDPDSASYESNLLFLSNDSLKEFLSLLNPDVI